MERVVYRIFIFSGINSLHGNRINAFKILIFIVIAGTILINRLKIPDFADQL